MQKMSLLIQGVEIHDVSIFSLDSQVSQFDLRYPFLKTSFELDQLLLYSATL